MKFNFKCKHIIFFALLSQLYFNPLYAEYPETNIETDSILIKNLRLRYNRFIEKYDNIIKELKTQSISEEIKIKHITKLKEFVKKTSC